MGFIENTEKKFGRFAIQGLTMKLAVLQVIFFVFYMLKFEDTGDSLSPKPVIETLYRLNIGNTTIISDLLLIIGAPALLPTGGFFSAIFFFFAIHLFVTWGTSLEELWGKYKFNVYIFTSVIVALLCSQISQLIAGPSAPLFFTSTIYMVVLFAFAVHFPAFQILLFFVLPTPIRIIAYLGAGSIILLMMGMDNGGRAFWGLSTFGVFILFHYKDFIQSQSQKARTKKYIQKNEKKASQAFHKCKVCDKTENDDDKLEFRIADDGEEYCTEHLPESK